MRLKVAVIGAGSMGMNHLRVLRDFDEELVHIVGIADPDEPNLRNAVSRFHVVGYADYSEMLAKTAPDLVAVVVPTHMHFEVASHVLDKGINVLLEKPMTSTIEQALALNQLARLRGVKLAIGHVERFNPAIIEVKRHLVAGELGRIFHLHARRLGPFPPRIRDVGVTLDLATHDIDVMRYLTNAEVEHVYAETQRRIHTSQEDLLLGIMRFTNQTIGMLDVNWLTPTKVRELSITGEKGMYLVNYLTQDVYFYENDYTPTNWDTLRSLTGVSEGTMTRLKVQKAEPLRLEYQDVINAIRQDVLPTVSGEDGVAVLKVVCQLAESRQKDESARPYVNAEVGADMQNLSSHHYPIVAVVGLGKIGLPLAVQYAEHGRRVIGCDINPTVIDTVNAGQSHVEEEPGLAARVARLVEEDVLCATLDTAAAVRRAEVVVVIVPVVVDERHEADFAGIDAATRTVGAGLQPGTLVIYETTLPVGTTSTRLRGILERESGLQAGQDFHLAYSPERVSSGSIFNDLRNYPKVVGGIDEPSLGAAVAFYRSALQAEIITMASTDEAEFVKLIETTYRDVNIALANELACFADARGLDVASAIRAANTQPYSHIHMPGVGVGGHCIPVYPYFLLAGVEQRSPRLLPPDGGLSMLTLPRSARRINDAMAEYAARRIEGIVGRLAGRSVLMLGVAYRGDVRESAFTSARLLQDALLARGATVYVDDPLFSERELQEMGYTPLIPEKEDEVCAILLQAGHQAYQKFDFSRFVRCQVVLDGRRVLHRERIEALGMRYVAIGDGSREQPNWESGRQSVVASLVSGGGE